MKTVNEQGLKEIRMHLSDLHKQKTFNDAEVLAVAAQVEESLNYGNGEAMFVIAANDSWLGKNEVCHIDDDGYDVEYFDAPTSIFGHKNHHDTNDCERYACRICA